MFTFGKTLNLRVDLVSKSRYSCGITFIQTEEVGIVYLSAAVARQVLEEVLHINVDPGVPEAYLPALYEQELDFTNVGQVMSRTIVSFLDLVAADVRNSGVSDYIMNSFAGTINEPKGIPMFNALQAFHHNASKKDYQARYGYMTHGSKLERVKVSKKSLQPIAEHSLYKGWTAPNARSIMPAFADLWQLSFRAAFVSPDVRDAVPYFTEMLEDYLQISHIVDSSRSISMDGRPTGVRYKFGDFRGYAEGVGYEFV